MLTAIILLLGAGFILSRSNKRKKQANLLLHRQNEQIESTIKQLKATQNQLIQSEKMASLGELTAGIAHEIQNPLNFVNNFSELNKELIDEMQSEIKADHKDEAIGLSDSIKENQEKINFHGKRAEAIVKSMLMHSRTSSNKKELTDINALVDEYLRLAYHGMRAKDKSFNAEFKTDFDPTLPKLNVIPQDIGRVLLNLINNAFQAVSNPQPRFDKLTASPEGGFTLNPIVIVSTKYHLPPLGGKGGERNAGKGAEREGGKTVEISISDNGSGIPDAIKDKIFQPFFTTKPAGQGTGLGLSLSYDIVKAHGGEIKVVSKEGEGTTMIIQLPAS